MSFVDTVKQTVFAIPGTQTASDIVQWAGKQVTIENAGKVALLGCAALGGMVATRDGTLIEGIATTVVTAAVVKLGTAMAHSANGNSEKANNNYGVATSLFLLSAPLLMAASPKASSSSAFSISQQVFLPSEQLEAEQGICDLPILSGNTTAVSGNGTVVPNTITKSAFSVSQQVFLPSEQLEAEQGICDLPILSGNLKAVSGNRTVVPTTITKPVFSPFKTPNNETCPLNPVFSLFKTPNNETCPLNMTHTVTAVTTQTDPAGSKPEGSSVIDGIKYLAVSFLFVLMSGSVLE